MNLRKLSEEDIGSKAMTPRFDVENLLRVKSYKPTSD